MAVECAHCPFLKDTNSKGRRVSYSQNVDTYNGQERNKTCIVCILVLRSAQLEI